MIIVRELGSFPKLRSLVQLRSFMVEFRAGERSDLRASANYPSMRSTAARSAETDGVRRYTMGAFSGTSPRT